MKMPAALKQKWIDALRSGEYQQGHHCLSEDGAYCCLGVLEKVAEGEVEMRDKGTFLQRSYPMPSMKFYERNGISFAGSAHSDLEEPVKLSRMNDEQRLSFPEIAEYIEQHVESY